MTVAALVPARSGSKGLPGKNTAEVGGRSLLRRAVDLGLGCSGVDRVLVSSDDAEILRLAREAGAEPWPRPPELARDDTPMISVITQVLTDLTDVEILVLLQPTSPLRRGEDVEACLAALGAGAPSSATVTRLEHPLEWCMRLDDGQALEPVLGWDAVAARRQDANDVYRLNGAVYAARRDWILSQGRLVGPGTVGVPMPAERSIDVDTALDLALARLLAGDS